jgi:D-arginine dehydrogenase
MEHVDVLIVGGGIAGASLGARLAGEMRVMVVEAEDMCGRHATGRSAAFWQASLGGNTPERKLSILFNKLGHRFACVRWVTVTSRATNASSPS